MIDPRLADLAGTTKQQIFKLRRGERNLTVQWAQRLAPHLGVEWYELVEGENPPAPDPSLVELLAAYQVMNEEQRKALLIMAKVMTPAEKATPDPPPKPKPHRTAACIVPVPNVRARR